MTIEIVMTSMRVKTGETNVTAMMLKTGMTDVMSETAH